MTLVSVITPTWQRCELVLGRCIPSVRAQIWPDVEHVVVSDGPDLELQRRIAGVPVVYVELDQHPNDDCNYGAYSRNHGLTVARGDLIAYLDDDNAFRPEHVAILADALLASDVDFAYTQMQRHPGGDIVGHAPPAHGSIDSSILMHRRGVPERLGLWPTPSPYAVDWELVKGWLERGATWTHVPAVTVDYWTSR